MPDSFSSLEIPCEHSEAELQTLFTRALREAVTKGPPPPLSVEFYAYTGLSSTIRLRQGRVQVRVSDLLRTAPSDVLYALARILIAKLYRRKAPAEAQRHYREYATQAGVREASEAARRVRGYKLTNSPQGYAYDLEAIFHQLNAKYFDGRLAKPRLSWSNQPTGRVFGHHDQVHETIIISRTLDDPQVPRLAVEFVLYHEMLHIKHPPRYTKERTIYHSPAFRQDERRFEGYEQANDLLEKLAAPVRRRRRIQRGRKRGSG